MKLCLLSPLPPPIGGIAQWTCMVLGMFRSHPQLCIIHVNTAPVARRPGEGTVFSRSLCGLFQLVREIPRLLIAFIRGADVVHLTTSGHLAIVRDVVFSIICRVFRKPVVYHIHYGGIPEVIEQRGLEWFMLSLAIRMASAVIVLDKESFRSIFSADICSNVSLIPNPVDFGEVDIIFEPSPHIKSGRRPYIAYLGRVSIEKGIRELLDAWKDIDRQDWDLVIIGPIDHRIEGSLKSNVNNIIWVGEVDHTAALLLLSECSIFCLPSYSEGFPIALLEAMALGKAIIATQVGGIPDMIGHDAGLLVNPRDTSHLRRVLNELILDPLLRDKLGSHARTKARKVYASDVVLKEYLSIWKSLGA